MRPLPLDRLVPRYVREFEVYIPSKPDAELKKNFNTPFLYRLNNNENPLGPPEAARERIKNFVPPRAAIYPSGDSYYLRQRLAQKFGLHPDQFIVGNGANEVIAFVIKAFCQTGDNIITADKTFAVYEWVAAFSGFEARLIPLNKDYEFDDREMFRQIDKKTKIIFICNPNNPTGKYWNGKKLADFLKAVDNKQIIVVDEAYFEFVETDDYPDGISLISEYPNLVIFRTFSKMYGLAGLRIGYLVGSLDVVNMIRKTCIVYSVNVLAQEAAMAALDDDLHIKKTREVVREGKALLKEELTRIGLSSIIGEGNFVMVKLPINDALAYRKLMTQGIMVRTMTGFRFPNWIRVTIAQIEVMEAFVSALKKILS